MGLNALVGPSGPFFGSLLGGAFGQIGGLQSVFLLFLPLFVLILWPLTLNRSPDSQPAPAVSPASRRYWRMKPSLAAAMLVALISLSHSPVYADFTQMEGQATALWLELRSVIESKFAAAGYIIHFHPW